MYPCISHMFSINDDENTLCLELRIWVYSYFVIEQAHALKCWGGKVCDFTWNKSAVPVVWF